MRPSVAATVASRNAGKVTAIDALAPAESPAARIRRARAILGELLVSDDLEENGLLMGAVAERLDRIMISLDQLAGRQHLFELFVSDAR